MYKINCKNFESQVRFKLKELINLFIKKIISPISFKFSFFLWAIAVLFCLLFLMQTHWTLYDDYSLLTKAFWPFHSEFANIMRAAGREQTLFAWYFHFISLFFGTNVYAHYLASAFFFFGTLALMLLLSIQLKAPTWSTILGLCCVLFSGTVPEEIFSVYKLEKSMVFFLFLFLECVVFLMRRQRNSVKFNLFTFFFMVVSLFLSGTLGKEPAICFLPSLIFVLITVWLAEPFNRKLEPMRKSLAVIVVVALIGFASVALYRSLAGVSPPQNGSYTKFMTFLPAFETIRNRWNQYEYITKDLFFVSLGCFVLALIALCNLFNVNKQKSFLVTCIFLLSVLFSYIHTIFYILFWYSVHVYYLYPSATFAGFSLIFAPLLVDKGTHRKIHFLVNAVIIVTTLVTMYFSIPFFQMRAYSLIAAQRADAFLVETVSCLPAKSIVGINFAPGSEMIYGSRVLLNVLYGRSDIILNTIFDPTFQTFAKTEGEKGTPVFLFTRSEPGTNWKIACRGLSLGKEWEEVPEGPWKTILEYRGQVMTFKRPAQLFRKAEKLEFNYTWKMSTLNLNNRP